MESRSETGKRDRAWACRCVETCRFAGGKESSLRSQLGVGSTFLADHSPDLSAPDDETAMPEARWHLDPLRAGAVS